MADYYMEMSDWYEAEHPVCRHCHKTLRWEHRPQGWRLINKDNSVHFCRNTVASPSEFGVVDG